MLDYRSSILFIARMLEGMSTKKMNSRHTIADVSVGDDPRRNWFQSFSHDFNDSVVVV